MAEKVALIADPGIDTAFAVALALHDPELDVLALGASAGNVSAKQATDNVHILINQLDPPKWPQLGAAIEVEFDIDGTQLHGSDGLAGMHYPCSTLHNIQPTDRLIVEMVRLHPGEVTVVCLGPLTAVSSMLERDPEFPLLVKRLICLGGTIVEPGNAGPVSEFHFRCDPRAAQQVLHCGAQITLIPLDVMRSVVYSPADMLDLPNPLSRTCQFLKKIVPFGIGTTSNIYGIEGFHLKDVLGTVAASMQTILSTEPTRVDIETKGELTRGMSVIDRRPGHAGQPNVDLATEADTRAVRNYIRRILTGAA